MEYGNAADNLFEAFNMGATASYSIDGKESLICIGINSVSWSHPYISGDSRRTILLTYYDEKHRIVNCISLRNVSKIDFLCESESGLIYAITTESIDGSKSEQHIIYVKLSPEKYSENNGAIEPNTVD